MLGTQLKSEWRKVSTSTMWWVVGTLIVMANVVACAFFTFVGLNVKRSPIDMNDPHAMDRLLTVGLSFSFILPLILGMLVVNLEFHNNTILYSLMANPTRINLYISKLITCAVSSTFFAIISALVSLGTVILFVSGSKYSLDVFSGQTWVTLASIVIVCALLGVIGGAMGALITKPLVAIVLVMLWSQVIEPIIRVVAPSETQRLTPSSLIDASLGGGFLGQMFNVEPIPQSVALMIIMMLAAVLALVGGVKFSQTEV